MDKFKIKQYVKMFMQNILLPLFYQIGRIKKVQPRLVIFADAHHDEIPYSMEELYQWFRTTDYKVISMTTDCGKAGVIGELLYMIRFMLIYASAGYVFICDNFLPVASCRKREETQVIQMWHAGGMLKKYGYDTTRDIPVYYKGNVFRNYTTVIVSDKNCIPAYESGMKASREIIQPLGLSRTDRFYDKEYKQQCREEFYAQYPECRDKKVVLWAPTFRGNAAIPDMIDMSFVTKLQRQLGEEWKVIVKLHPHLGKDIQETGCRIATERLLPVADVLISDYSSVIYDYLLLEKPLVFYVPDLRYYMEKQEFYIDYYEMPGKIVTHEKELGSAVLTEYENYSVEELRKFKEKYMSACDGKAMKRLIDYLKL